MFVSTRPRSCSATPLSDEANDAMLTFIDPAPRVTTSHIAACFVMQLHSEASEVTCGGIYLCPPCSRLFFYE